MPGRHRRPSMVRHRAARVPMVVGAVVVGVTSAIVVTQNFADAGGCASADGVTLRVAADPAIAPALREVAEDWTGAGEPAVRGRCVDVEVTGAATADVAGDLAADAGGVLDVAAEKPSEATSADPEPETLPAVWVPDSSYWVWRVRSISRSFFEDNLASLASSPIVLGASAEGAAALGEAPVTPAALREPMLAALADPQSPPPLPLALAEPRRDTAGLVGAHWWYSAVVESDEDLPRIVGLYRSQGDAPPDTKALLPAFGDGLAVAPVSEQAIIAYNRTDPAARVTAVPVADAPTLDFPYAVLERQPRDVRSAATLFLTALGHASEVFARHGFRSPDGVARPDFPVGDGVSADPVPALPVGPPERFDRARRIWTSATSDARVLSVVNVNASMRLPMRMPDGSTVPRLQVFQSAAVRGLEMFTDGTDLGHWEYAVRLDGDRDWVERVPIDLLTAEHAQDVRTAIESVQTRASDEAALCETLLAAYEEMKQGWDPARSNTLVLWTDTGSTKPGGLALDETLRELERLADLTRPVRVILLGLGPDADMTQLEALAEATGGGAFQVLDPSQIETIFLRALLALPPA